MHRLAITASLGLLLALPVAASAQGFAPAKGADALRYRQSSMFMMGQSAGQLAAMIKGDKPYNQELAVHHAELVHTFSTLPWDSFWVAGSDQGKHRMKPAIFKEKEEFLSKAKTLQDETAKLVEVAKTGDQGALKTQFGAVGKACKSCHDEYREE